MEARARAMLPGNVSVASAGFLPAGEPMPPKGVAVAAERGMNLAGHRSSTLDPASLDAYDLILTAARSHSRSLVADNPDVWPRVFTLKQFAAWASGRSWDGSVPFRDWLECEAADRPRAELVGDSDADDLRDPLTGSSRVWRAVADEIDDALRRGPVSVLLQRR